MGVKQKKIIKKKKTVTTGDDGIPKVVEEIMEEEVPEVHEISIRDESETTIEGIVRPIITEAYDDETTHAEIKIEEIEEVKTVPSEEKYSDHEIPIDVNEPQKKVVKKKKIIKKKKTVTTGDDGIPKVVEEITEEEAPEVREISIRDESETTIEGIVRP